MKLGDIISSAFYSSLEELMKTPLDIEISYNLSELLDKVNKERDKFKKLRLDLIKKYANKDEEGNPKIVENSSGVKEYDIENREAFDVEFDKLLSIHVELPTINLNSLKGIKLSASCVKELKPLLRTY